MKNCPKLYKIKLEHNLIDNFENLKCLSKYHITKINLEGNPLVSTNENYRDELFKLVPSLECIDGYGKDGQEIESTVYGGEEEEEDAEYGEEEGEEEGDISDEEEEGEDEGDDGEDDGDDDDDEEDEDEPQKKRKD